MSNDCVAFDTAQGLHTAIYTKVREDETKMCRAQARSRVIEDGLRHPRG